MKDDRNWNDPQYKAWRLAVYKRDGFTCQFPGCSRKGFGAKIQAHHIRRWADAPELRFQISNGVTLCKRCHASIEAQEQVYEPIFMRIVSQKNNFDSSPTTTKSPKTPDGAMEARRFLYLQEEDEGSLPC